VVGACRPLPAEAQDAARSAFALRHPQSQALALPDFTAFLLTAQEIRWVGGFAAAAWLAPHTLRGG